MHRSDRPSAPESYVVRIYRRDARLPARIAGTVEQVTSGSEFGFRNLRELERILTRRDSPGRRTEGGTAA